MRKVLFALFFLACHIVPGQPFFEKRFGNPAENCIAVSMIQTSNGKIICAANCSDSLGTSSISLYIFDSSGVDLNTIYIPENNETVSRIYRFANDDVLVVGSYTDSTGNNDGLLMKMDTAGAVIWRLTVGRSFADETLQGASINADGTIAAGGLTPNLSGQGNSGYFAKSDPDGNFLFDKTFTGSANSYIDAVLEIPGNKYIISGDRQLPNNNYTNYTLCTDDSANVLWDVALPNPYNNGCKNDLITVSGDIVIVGESSTASNPIFDPAITRMDTTGFIKWSYIYPGSALTTDALFDVTEVQQEEFLATGYGGNPLTGSADVLLMRFDSAGNEIGRIFIGDSTGFDIGYSIVTDKWKRGCFIAGTTVENGFNRGYLIFTGLMGISSAGGADYDSELILYPVPASHTLYIKSSFAGSHEITIYNLNGQMEGRCSGENAIDIRGLENGIYIARIAGDDHVIHRKFCVSR